MVRTSRNRCVTGSAPITANFGRSVLVGLVLLTLTSAAEAFTSCTPVTLSAGPASLPEEQEDPAVAGKSIYLSYSDLAGLKFRASHDAGLTWSSQVLDPSGILPRIVASRSNVYIAWLTQMNAKWFLAFARSEDGGNTFSLSNLGPFYSIQPVADGEPQMAVSGSLVAIISRPDANHMAAEISNDHGRTFSQALLPTFGITPNEGYIVAFAGNIAVVWNDVGDDGLTKILLSVSADAGHSFSQPQSITPQGVGAYEPQLSVLQATGTLYLVWRDTGTPHGPTVGFLSESGDFGTTWSTPRLLDPSAHRARQFSVAAAGRNVYVAYLTQQAGHWWTRLLVSRDAAGSFDAPISLGNSGLTGQLRGEDHAPRMWASGRYARIVFDVEGALRIGASDDSGMHFAPGVLLGQGESALVTRNTALWLSDSGAARFAQCR